MIWDVFSCTIVMLLLLSSQCSPGIVNNNNDNMFQCMRLQYYRVVREPQTLVKTVEKQKKKIAWYNFRSTCDDVYVAGYCSTAVFYRYIHNTTAILLWRYSPRMTIFLTMTSQTSRTPRSRGLSRPPPPPVFGPSRLTRYFTAMLLYFYHAIHAASAPRLVQRVKNIWLWRLTECLHR